MKIKTLCDGGWDEFSYVVGDIVEGDNEHTRNLLANGLAEPLDEKAEALLESGKLRNHERSSLLKIADELKGVLE